MRRNINITLDKDLVAWIDDEISRNNFRSRSHLIQKAVQMFKNGLESQKGDSDW